MLFGVLLADRWYAHFYFSGGHVLAHASTVRLYVRKGKGEQRVVKVSTAANGCQLGARGGRVLSTALRQ